MTHEETTALVRRANASGFESIAEYAVSLEETVGWLLPYATYPECTCQKTSKCECNLEEAERNYRPTIERASALMREFRKEAA